MKVFSDLKSRGCHDILIAATDGLKGTSEALAAVYPATTLQTCIVHLLRHSLAFGNWEQRKPLAAALRPIYTAPSADAAMTALDDFERGPWGRQISDGRGELATRVGPRHSVLRLPAGNSSRHLHDERP